MGKPGFPGACTIAVSAILACLSGPGFSEAAPGVQVSMTGVVQLLQEDDFAAGLTRRIYLLEDTATGRTYSLNSTSSPSAYHTRSDVTLP